jgi:dTDP-4-amino-4,6-dideoxygalactose transaminase
MDVQGKVILITGGTGSFGRKFVRKMPVYLHPYHHELGYEPGLYPKAERLYETILTLPFFPAMTDDDVQDVVEAARWVIGESVAEKS